MKPEWGRKHECPKCRAHYYDMQKPDAACPKCQTPANDLAALMTKKGKPDAPKPSKKVSLQEELDDLETDFDDTAFEDDLLEDSDELVGDDENDMAEVMEHIEGEERVDQL